MAIGWSLHILRLGDSKSHAPNVGITIVTRLIMGGFLMKTETLETVIRHLKGIVAALEKEKSYPECIVTSTIKAGGIKAEIEKQ